MTVEMLDSLVFSMRMCLALISQQFDPTGLLAPLFIAMKIEMRTVVALKRPWDDPLPDQLQATWRAFAKSLLEFPRVGFPRSVRPPNPIGRPELIGFWDGSDYAYSACVYVRWRTSLDTWHVSLATSKVRVTSSSGITTPRSELSGLVVGVRLLDNLLPALEIGPLL